MYTHAHTNVHDVYVRKCEEKERIWVTCVVEKDGENEEN